MPNSPSVRVYETASAAETTQLGRTLGERLQPGDTVLLIGDLGAGKTCFIQGLCSGLGVEEPVTSPTFTLINEYQGRLRCRSRKIRRFRHLVRDRAGIHIL